MTQPPVLVTGAAGFIGRQLVLDLRGSGIPVRALLRPHHDGQDLEAAGAEILRGDAADRILLREASANCNVIYHLAAARGQKKLSQAEYCEQNTRLQDAVAEAALTNAARVIAASTVATMRGHPPLAAADAPPRPVSRYALSRSQNEQQLHETWKDQGLDYRIVRIAERVAGPGARDWGRIIRGIQNGRYKIL
ncbi:MAG: NAD(P)-dependent oxidoreductase, partial [Pseudomonadota bacterium]